MIFFYIILPMCLLPAAWFLINIIRCFAIRRQIMSIRKSDSFEAEIICKKVRFLFHPKDRRHYEITALLLTSEHGEEYCCVFPRGSAPLDSDRKLLRQHLEDKQLTLICYRDTRIIQFLDLPKGDTL